MKKSIKWFSIVEIITTTAIIAVLAIIWFTFSSNYQSNQYNSSRVADLTAIYNLLQTNYTQDKTYPDPSWNKQYFDKNWTYSHWIDWAFWVSWFLTQKTLSKDKMWYPFRDEQTKNYYGYWKRLDWNSGYNLATVLNEKWEYFSYVVWDIGWNRIELAGLVKEYAGPNFVTSKSKYLPYNPYELKLTGKISVYSGSVSIIDNSNSTITSNILDQEIEKWNKVTVWTGWLATINLSDWTELKLGSNSQNSILDFSDLEYKDNSNLLTKVMLNLSLGEIWVKAPQLDSDSTFEITNSFAAASVRWTIFWMTTNSASWSISLIQWKLEVWKITSKTDEDVETIPFFKTQNTWSWLIYDSATNKSYLEILDSTKPINLNYTIPPTNITPVSDATWSTSEISTGKILEVEAPQLKFNSGIIPNVTSLVRTSNKLAITVDNIWADYIEIIWTLYWEIKDKYSSWIINPTTFTGITIPWTEWSTNYAIKLCKTINDRKKACTWEFIQRTSGQSIDEATINNFKKNASNFNTSCEKWKKPFKNYWCLEDKLVAYAPYNESGDIYMNTDNWDILWFETVSVVSTSKISTPYILLENTKTLKDSLLPKIWGLNYTPILYTSTSTFWIYDSDISNTSTLNFISVLWLKDYKPATSFMSYPAWNWGIFIDNSNDGTLNDYMKYNISKLSLKDKFTIEIGVRWAALNIKRADKIVLFALGKDEDTSTQLGLQINKSWTNDLVLNVLKWSSNYTIKSWMQNLILEPNKFYKLNFILSDSKVKVFLNWTLLNSLWIPSITSYSYNLINNIKIGSDLNKNYQWNDIIDYVKIYKN
ncbi:MAG: hypothetical protein ACD_49C00022G0001 [uncultured bacterium (gcode 4)]|uniref:Uncharacterized protein n=1 Tax=uncultured bacterium (gcode 4) TaxID=1234023 RepID=K2BD69_9BACT|nr:MAG: hypothetical protein ACD_49C00022G0001 [uncultured bacterium (gcode 4)]